MSTMRAFWPRSAIWRAMAAMFCSCSASETRMMARLRLSWMASFNAPTESMPSRSSHCPYSRKASSSFGYCGIGVNCVGVLRSGKRSIKPPPAGTRSNHFR